MSWKRLIEDDGHLALAREIADACAARPHEGHTDELVDAALMRAYLGCDDGAEDDLGQAALGDAIAILGEQTVGPGLYGGAARIGWTVAHLTDGDDADAVCRAIDGSLTAMIDARRWQHYDLISGTVGFGVYALERGDAGRPLALRILDELERTARPLGAGVSWFTSPDLLPTWQRAVAPNGYWNLGLAHGVPGVIGVLARYVAHDVDAPRARRLLEGAIAWLEDAAPPRASGRFPGWIPEGATAESHGGRPAAWCYGDLGIAFTLLAAASATGREDWRELGLTLAHAAAAAEVDGAGVRDMGICHGAAGNAHLFNRLWQATGDESFADAARRWLARALAMRRPGEAIAGFPMGTLDGDKTRWEPDASLLTGAPGIALVLQAAVTEVEPSWDRLLMADLSSI